MLLDCDDDDDGDEPSAANNRVHLDEAKLKDWRGEIDVIKAWVDGGCKKKRHNRTRYILTF